MFFSRFVTGGYGQQSYVYHTTNTSDVEQVFDQASGRDLSPLFHLYLYTIDKLEINVRPMDATHYRVQLLNMEMPLPLDITTNTGYKPDDGG